MSFNYKDILTFELQFVVFLLLLRKYVYISSEYDIRIADSNFIVVSL